MSNTTFITDQKGKKISAVLPIKAYKHLMDELEELEDIRAYDKAKAKKENPILLKDAIQQRRKKKQKSEYTVLILPSVQKQLDKLPNYIATRIEDKLIELGVNPRPAGSKKLKGRDAYRIRISDYRAIYDIADNKLIITVINVAHRKDVYQ